jgi:hypothetical protein
MWHSLNGLGRPWSTGKRVRALTIGAGMAEPEPNSAPPIPTSEHSRVLIAMHKAMRVDSKRLITAVDAMPAGDIQHAAALGRAFAAIVGLIHDDHWTEDDVMYPFLLERVRTFEGDAIRLENDHVELDAAMARINARFRLLAHQLSARPWQDTIASLSTGRSRSVRSMTGASPALVMRPAWLPISLSACP